MSRVGKSPIPVSKQVTVNIGSNNLVTVKGPKGEQSLQVDLDILLKMEEGQLVLSRPTEQKRHKAMHGLYRSLLHNMVVGVTEGFKKELEVIGVGFRANMQDGVLELALGYSHPIYFVAPDGIEINVDTKRSKNSFIIVEGIDKQMVGQVAAKIRSLRPPEPYKGKGVRYSDEFVRRKAGKTAAR